MNDNARRYRSHAVEILAMRDNMTDKACRRMMEEIARDYEKMALSSERISKLLDKTGI